TIGGLIVNKFGHLPKRGDAINIENIRVTVVRADSRRLHSVTVEVLPEEPFPIEAT
ncbi:MAG TPA: magnesium/cobalt efflux protein, partial [Methylophilaceae bacterium]|nr:magnesium/cobalt efflux protein [Methylophilaceae bacterium]